MIHIYYLLLSIVLIWIHDRIKITSLSCLDIAYILFYKIRYCYLCPWNSFIYPGCELIFSSPQNISIGNRSFLNRNVKLYAELGKIHIGNQCLVGFNTIISTATHQTTAIFRDRATPVFRNVYIGNNVWIGASVSIIGGVRVGDNSIIGAGSLVHQDIPKDCIYAGNPARFIRTITHGETT